MQPRLETVKQIRSPNSRCTGRRLHSPSRRKLQGVMEAIAINVAVGHEEGVVVAVADPTPMIKINRRPLIEVVVVLATIVVVAIKIRTTSEVAVAETTEEEETITSISSATKILHTSQTIRDSVPTLHKFGTQTHSASRIISRITIRTSSSNNSIMQKMTTCQNKIEWAASSTTRRRTTVGSMIMAMTLITMTITISRCHQAKVNTITMGVKMLIITCLTISKKPYMRPDKSKHLPPVAIDRLQRQRRKTTRITIKEIKNQIVNGKIQRLSTRNSSKGIDRVATTQVIIMTTMIEARISSLPNCIKSISSAAIITIIKIAIVKIIMPPLVQIISRNKTIVVELPITIIKIVTKVEKIAMPSLSTTIGRKVPLIQPFMTTTTMN